MKIGILGPIWFNIPPKKYGGTELVVYNLVNELSKKHDVTLFGPKTTKVSSGVRVIPTTSRPLRESGVPWTDIVAPLSHITRAFDMIKQFDVLHVHLNTIQDLVALPLSVNSKTPILFTPHFTLAQNHNHQRSEFLKKYSHLPFTSISYSQQKLLKLNYIKTVYNGLDLARYPFFEKPKNYFAWIGRMAPWKGAREAIMAARKTGIKLILIGPYDPSIPVSAVYFSKIKPLLDGRNIIWKKDLTFAQKIKIIGNARGLLNPIRWQEPFGLVMAESQALGTPVISFNNGAAPELITEGESGFLVKNSRGMIKKIPQVSLINRKEVRKNAENFSAQRMAEGYMEAYKMVIKNWNNYLAKAPRK